MQYPKFFKKLRSRYKINDQYFDSSWELAVWIWAKENEKNIIRLPKYFEYEFKGRIHRYFPDFEIDGQLIEIKGDQFLNREGDLKNPFDESQNDFVKAKQKCMENNNIQIWLKKELTPIIKFVENIYGKKFWRKYEY